MMNFLGKQDQKKTPGSTAPSDITTGLRPYTDNIEENLTSRQDNPSTGNQISASLNEESPQFATGGFDGIAETTGNQDLQIPLIIPVSANPARKIKMICRDSMSFQGFIQIPRSLLEDPRYRSAPRKYRDVLMVILENCAYSQTTHAIGSTLIPIQKGQLCITERRLVELCNRDVKIKEDLVDKNIVRRSIVFFGKCQFVNQQVNQGKTLLTITLPGYYEGKKIPSEPTSEPKVNQERTTKYRNKEREEDKKSIESMRSTFSKKENEEGTEGEINRKQVDSLIDLATRMGNQRKKKSQIKVRDVELWLRNHDYQSVEHCISKTFRQPPGKVKSDPAYVTSLLELQVASRDFNTEINRKWYRDFCEAQGNDIVTKHITVEKKYLKHSDGKREIYFGRDKKVFEKWVMDIAEEEWKMIYEKEFNK